MASFVIVPKSTLYLAGMVAQMPTLQHLIDFAHAQTALTATRALHIVRALVDVLTEPLKGTVSAHQSFADMLAAAKTRAYDRCTALVESILQAVKVAFGAEEAEYSFVCDCAALLAELYRVT